MNITEAFHRLNLLESEEFNISLDSDTNDLRDFLDNDEDTEDVDIIDVKAETEDDVEDSYIGKIVIECAVCHSKFYKDPEEIEIDDESGMCNMEEECPVCMSQDGYKIIGKIAPYDGQDIDDDVDDIDDDVDDIESVSIDDEDMSDDLEESYRRVGAFRKASRRPRRLSESVRRRRPIKKHLHEDFESARIETADQIMSMDSDGTGKITITTEPKRDPEMMGRETIAPLDFDDAMDIADAQPEPETEEDEFDEVPPEEDVDMDEFDEQSFDELGESYLRKVYENVNSYKTSKVKSRGNKLIIEGKIKFKSGKVKNTSFIFESYTVGKNGKYKLIGENAQITRGKNAFTLSGRMRNNKFITESLNYRYTQKDTKGKSTKIYGTVKK